MILKSIIRKIIVFVCIFCLYSISVFASDDIEISADKVEYYETGVGMVIAQGHVALNWQDKKVFADQVKYFIDKKSIAASGNVITEQKGNVVYSESVVYNYDDETGKVIETFSPVSGMFYIRSKSMDMLEKNTFHLKHTTFSTCDLNEPHSHFKSHRGKLILNKRVTFYNAVFYIGKIPVLYLPFVIIPLKGLDLLETWKYFRVEIESGWSSREIKSGCREGIYVKTTVFYYFSDKDVIKFKYDHLGNRGQGLGGEFHRVSKNGRLNLEAYTAIKEGKDKNGKRWKIRPDLYQKLSDKWTLRCKADLTSDPDFDNIFFHEKQNNWNKTIVPKKLSSSLDITRGGHKTNFDTSIKCDYRYNKTKKEYEITSAEFPKVSWNRYQTNLIWGITHKPSFKFNRIYEKHGHKYDANAKPFYKMTAEFEYDLSRPFKIGKKITLTPGLNITPNWYDKNDKNELEHSLSILFGGKFNTRIRVTDWMNWNFDYNLKTRTKTKPLKTDTSLQKPGIEQHDVTFRNDVHIFGDKVTVGNRVTYKFTDKKTSLKKWSPINTEATKTPPKKWSPINTDVTWTPKSYLTVNVQHSRKISPFEFKSMKIRIDVGKSKASYLNIALICQRPKSYKKLSGNSKMEKDGNIKIDIPTEFGLWLNPKWRVDCNINVIKSKPDHKLKFDKYEIKLYRDCHCWQFCIIYEKTNKAKTNSEKFCFKFDIKTNMPFSKNSNNSGYNNESFRDILSLR